MYKLKGYLFGYYTNVPCYYCIIGYISYVLDYVNMVFYLVLQSQNVFNINLLLSEHDPATLIISAAYRH